jgi:phosphopantothenoylcysteine decarboxylase/phosphopantothenate--cysteine ligase
MLLASERPVVIVPVANESMILHPATRRNLEVLRSDGYLVVDPPKALEIATREGLDERVGPFPYPDLLMYLSAVASGKHSAIPTRPKS